MWVRNVAMAVFIFTVWYVFLPPIPPQYLYVATMAWLLVFCVYGLRQFLSGKYPIEIPVGVMSFVILWPLDFAALSIPLVATAVWAGVVGFQASLLFTIKNKNE